MFIFLSSLQLVTMSSLSLHLVPGEAKSAGEYFSEAQESVGSADYGRCKHRVKLRIKINLKCDKGSKMLSKVHQWLGIYFIDGGKKTYRM